MGRRFYTPPNVIQLDTITIWFVFLLIIIGILGWIVIKPLAPSAAAAAPIVHQTTTVKTESPFYDPINSPYFPPLRPLWSSFGFTSSSPRQVGILSRQTQDGEGDVLPLMAMPLQLRRDLWYYYTMNNSSTFSTKLPLKINGRPCTMDRGCDPLYTGDTVLVDGLDKTFVVKIYETGM